MPAVLASPTHAFLTLNETSTRSPASDTPVTRPTVTPAIRTGLPGWRPAASVK